MGIICECCGGDECYFTPTGFGNTTAIVCPVCNHESYTGKDVLGYYGPPEDLNDEDEEND